MLLLQGQLDSHLVDILEHKLSQVRFKSVDAEPIDQLINQDQEKQTSILTTEEQLKLQAIYQKAIPGASITWSTVPMSADELPVVITISELMKRLQAMAQLQPHMGSTPLVSLQAAINVNHPLAKKLVSLSKENKQIELATKAYQLGLLAQNMLNGAELTKFIKSTAALLG